MALQLCLKLSETVQKDLHCNQWLNCPATGGGWGKVLNKFKAFHPTVH